MFRPTDEDCADCGGDAFAATDVFDDGVGSTDAIPLCFGCYVDRLDRVRVCGTVRVSTDGGAGDVTVGAPDADEAERVTGAVAREFVDSGVDADVRGVEKLGEARDRISDYHARELARAERSESRHVYASTGRRGTVVDVETRTEPDIRDALAGRLTQHVLERRDVRKRADVADGVTTVFPTLAEHRATRPLGVEERVWKRAKERGVSEASERAARNHDVGREFEKEFVDWCDDRNLEAVRGKKALVRLYPDVADEIALKTDGLAGVPDFLVRGDGQRFFGDGWRPDGDVFVEVKRGTSRLSREQERVVAHLKSHGFDVYVLRGEPDDQRFERR